MTPHWLTSDARALLDAVAAEQRDADPSRREALPELPAGLAYWHRFVSEVGSAWGLGPEAAADVASQVAESLRKAVASGDVEAFQPVFPFGRVAPPDRLPTDFVVNVHKAAGWLREAFPHAAGGGAPPSSDVLLVSGFGQQCVDSKPIRQRQNEEILSVIGQLRYPPMAVPDGGKKEVKHQCEERDRTRPPHEKLFRGTSVFDTVWKAGSKVHWQMLNCDAHAGDRARRHKK